MSVHEIEIDEARLHFDHMLAEVRSGIDIVLSDHHTPVARIISCNQVRDRKPGLCAGGMITVADDFDVPLADSFWTGANR